MKFVLVGGGEIGRPGTSMETVQIDKEIVALSGKRNPTLLFIPTASGDSLGYIRVIEDYFGKKHGCRVEVLRLYRGASTTREMEKKIMSADIIYVGGGNTFRMMRMWRKKGVDVLLRKAAHRGAVLAGVSAGAICWCAYGNSDSRKMTNPSADYIRVRGLNLVSLFLAPHFNVEKGRQRHVRKVLKGTQRSAIGLDNCSAVVIKGASFKIVTSKADACVRRPYWRGNTYCEEIVQAREYTPLSDLLSQKREEYTVAHGSDTSSLSM